MGSPADIGNNRNINPGFIHTVDEFICGSQLGVLLGVQNSETGVAINILIAVFLHLGWKDMGVKVDNHRRIIAKDPVLPQPSAPETFYGDIWDKKSALQRIKG